MVMSKYPNYRLADEARRHYRQALELAPERHTLKWYQMGAPGPVPEPPDFGDVTFTTATVEERTAMIDYLKRLQASTT
jgi:hypothetical protein